MDQIIECVPNFSEGRNKAIIDRITAGIAAVEGVKLLNVDAGAATNRTVVTFAGTPQAVVEAAFTGIKIAAQLIDMRQHKGEHPRIGATDVCPLIPVAGITMEETVQYARRLARRVGEALQIPVYCYEEAAFCPERRNLAYCRSGEYEGLAKKLTMEAWKPDFGPSDFTPQVARTGLSVIGARDFLVAVNFNLNTTSTRRAHAIACDVREKGRKAMQDGRPVLDREGQPVWQPGSLKYCKAIGWYIEEYGIAQVSMNLTNISKTPLHVAFDEICAKAAARGIRVSGTEIVGLIPKSVLTDAAVYFLRKQRRSAGVSEQELIKIAIKSMGLDDLRPFDPKEKVLEFLLADETVQKGRLVQKTCRDFAYETASESPAPGGGSISAYMGSLAAALGTMVANLSAGKRGWDEKWEYFSDWAQKGQALLGTLLDLVDEDTASFNKLMDAFALPKTGEAEKAARSAAIEKATLYAIEVPLRTMKTAFSCFDLVETMAEKGNPNSVSDAGVGALAALAAVKGAYLNVRINAASLQDKQRAGELLAEAGDILALAVEREKRIWNTVLQTI